MSPEEKARLIAQLLREFIAEHPKEVKGYAHQLGCNAQMFDVIGDRFARREKAA